MPKKQKKKTRRTKKSEYYEVVGGKVNRKRISCPKCGPGVFMAEHKDRYHCGRCKYTIMKNTKGESIKQNELTTKPEHQGNDERKDLSKQEKAEKK